MRLSSLTGLAVAAAALASSGALSAQSADETQWRREILETSRLRQEGAFTQAAARLSKLVALLQKVAPDAHPLASALNAQGLVHADRGDLAAADQALRRAQRIWENAGSRYRDRLTQCISNRVSVYLEGGDLEAAERLLRSSLPEHGAAPDPAAAGLLYHLGALYGSQGRYAEAIRYTEQAVELWSTFAGPRDVALAPMFNALGLACARTGRPEAAIGHFERSLDILGGAADPIVTIKVLVNLAGVYAQTRRHADADVALVRARGVVERTLGPEDPLLAAALRSHAPVLRKLGRKSEAKAADRLADAILRAHPLKVSRAQTVDVADLAKPLPPR